MRAAHAEFFAAGAQVATTASYQVSYEGLRAIGRDAAETDEVLVRSVRLATEARDDAPAGRLGGGVGRAVRSDARRRLRVPGRRRPDGDRAAGLAPPTAAGARRRRAPTCSPSRPSPGSPSSRPLAAELDGLGTPAWFSVTVSGGTLRTGESLDEAFAIAAGAPGVVAVGVNCCEASEVSGALRVARAVGDLPTLAYPNSGEVWDGESRTWTGTLASARRPRPGMGGRRRDADRRLLPHRTGRHHRDRPAPRCRCTAMTGDAAYRDLSFWHDSLPAGSLAPRAPLAGDHGCRRRDRRRRTDRAVDRLVPAGARTGAQDRRAREGDRGFRRIGAQRRMVQRPLPALHRIPRAHARTGRGARHAASDGRDGRRGRPGSDAGGHRRRLRQGRDDRIRPLRRATRRGEGRGRRGGGLWGGSARALGRPTGYTRPVRWVPRSTRRARACILRSWSAASPTPSRAAARRSPSRQRFSTIAPAGSRPLTAS